MADATDVSVTSATTFYTPFGGAPAQTMNVWEGEHIALLVQPDSEFNDAAAVAGIVDELDQAYEFYHYVTGAEPTPYAPTLYDGRATIAILSINPADAALGYVGYTGIELQPWIGTAVFEAHASGFIEHTPLYEFGRNFWIFSTQLGSLDSMVNGYAAFNQFLAADAVGLTIYSPDDPSQSVPQAPALLQAYLGDPEASWKALLERDGYDPITIGGLETNAGGLAGSLYYRIYADWGLTAYADFWHVMSEQPGATTAEEARDNFLAAARLATGEDYGFLFKEAGVIVTEPDDTDGHDHGCKGYRIDHHGPDRHADGGHGRASHHSGGTASDGDCMAPSFHPGHSMADAHGGGHRGDHWFA